MGRRPLGSWTVTAVGWAGVAALAAPLARSATCNLLSWLWALVDSADLRRLIAWERRWYSHRVSVPVSAALTLGTVLPLYLLALRGSGGPVPAGTLYIGLFIVFVVMQNAYGVVMMAPEAYKLSTYKYELYRLSPADSVVVWRSLHGYN